MITGYGRLGSWFAAEHYGVRPDLVTFAKAITSGYQPLGGVLLGAAPRAGLEADPEFVLRHGFTYSGLDVGFAIAPLVFGPMMDGGQYTHVLWGAAALR